MASSRTDSQTAFLLQELTACWDQGYDALARGEIDRVTALMAIADGHLRGLPPATADTNAERELRSAANAARGRLEHGVRAGMTGVRDELRHARNGAKALNGYKDARLGIGELIERDA